MHSAGPAQCWTGELLALYLGPELAGADGGGCSTNAVIFSIASALLQV